VALTDCPECGRQISTLAAACPHCGFPMSGGSEEVTVIPREPGPSRWTDPGFWVIVVGLAAVIIMSILILQRGWNGSGPEPTAPATTIEAVNGA